MCETDAGIPGSPSAGASSLVPRSPYPFRQTDSPPQYILLESIPLVFGGVYGFTIGQSGLAFITQVVGSILGLGAFLVFLLLQTSLNPRCRGSRQPLLRQVISQERRAQRTRGAALHRHGRRRAPPHRELHLRLDSFLPYPLDRPNDWDFDPMCVLAHVEVARSLTASLADCGMYLVYLRCAVRFSPFLAHADLFPRTAASPTSQTATRCTPVPPSAPNPSSATASEQSFPCSQDSSTTSLGFKEQEA